MKPPKQFDSNQMHLAYLYLKSAASNGQPLKQVLSDLSNDETFFNFKNRLTTGQSTDLVGYFVDKGLFPSTAVDVMLAAQEEGGLESALEVLALDAKNSSMETRSVSGTLFWPASLAVLLLFLLAICLIFVVPTFKTVYASFGGELPMPTLILIGVSEALAYVWPLLLILIFALIFGWKKARPFAHRVGLKWGLYRRFCDMAFAYQALSWASVVHNSKSLSGKVALHLEATAPVFHSTHAKNLLASVTSHSGHSAYSEAVPSSLRSPFTILDAKKRAAAFGESASIARESSRYSFARLTSIITLVSYGFAGAVTGFLLIAVYLPIFKLGQVV